MKPLYFNNLIFIALFLLGGCQGILGNDYKHFDGPAPDTATNSDSSTDSDKSTDTVTDTNSDTGSDKSTDTVTDTNSDSGSDTVTDTGSDTVTDTGSDTVTDTGSDTVTDTGSDTGLKDCDTGTYSDCYSCAIANASVCGDVYSTCLTDPSCVSLFACIDGPIPTSCVFQGLTGDAWDACETSCKNAATATAIATRDAVYDCTYCTCKTTRPEGTYCSEESCDDISDKCYEHQSGNYACWGCALNTTCKTKYEACSAIFDCTGLDTCMNENCNIANPVGGDWNTCKLSCEQSYPNGVAPLAAYQNCIYCDACPNTCAADAGGKCD